MTSISKIAVACAALATASGAFAQKAGDNIVGLGFAYISPDASLGPLTSTNLSLGADVGGATAKLSSETTISLGWLHMYSDNIGAEVTIGIPPKHTMDVNAPLLGALGNLPNAATAKVLTPTAVAKYFFNTPADTWRPYLGLGVTHASFSSVSPNTSNIVVNALAGNGASMSSSWAPVYNAGVIYNIDSKWSINGSVSYIPLTSKVSFAGANQAGVGAFAGATTTGDLKLNVTDYVIRLGYKF